MGEQLREPKIFFIDKSGNKKYLGKAVDANNITAESEDLEIDTDAFRKLGKSAKLTIEKIKELSKLLAKMTRTKKEKQQIKQFNKNSFRKFIRKH